jgi:N-acylneuraminate cytidylyltransferase
VQVIDWCQTQGEQPEFTCCIYATAPMLRAEDLIQALGKLKASPEKSYAFSVTTFPYPIQRALCFDADRKLRMCQPQHEQTRSQDLPKTFHDAGQFYWGRTEAFKGGLPVFSPGSIPYELPRYRVQDIDDEADWRRAELMAAALRDEW